MARLPYLDKSQLAPEHQDLLKREIALHKQLAHSPGALRAFQGLGQYIRHHSPLDARLRELAILQVGYLARAPYEWSHHIKIGYDFAALEFHSTNSEAPRLQMFDQSLGRRAKIRVAKDVRCF